MQISVTSVRAVVRRHQGQLYPFGFLYHTKTILRQYADHNYAPSEDQDSGVRSRRVGDLMKEKPNRGHDITQEQIPRASRPGSGRRPPIDEGVPFESRLAKLEGSTMTPKELARFKSLLETPPKASMRSKAKSTPRKHVRPAFPEPLRALVAEAQRTRATKPVKNDESLTMVPDQYLVQVTDEMDNADTDVVLWDTMHNRVFNQVADFDKKLNNAQTLEESKKLRMLAESLPQLLMHFMRLIQTSFEGSPLGVVLLPTIKQLAPSAFALLVTTDIYTEHMRLLYEKYSDLDGIAETLSEMDREVYEFNVETKGFLASIMKHAQASVNGQNGKSQQALWTTDRKTRALTRLEHWHRIVDERVNEAAVREAEKNSVNLLDQ